MANAFRVSPAGFRALLKGPEIQGVLETEARAMAGRATSKNPGGVYDVLPYVGKSRAGVTVATSNRDPATQIHERKHNTLRNSIGG